MLKENKLRTLIKGLQNLYAWVRFPPAPPNVSGYCENVRPLCIFSSSCLYLNVIRVVGARGWFSKNHPPVSRVA